MKNKIYKYMISISKNVSIDKLDDIVNKYNNTYHSKIKIKPVHIKPSKYFNSSKQIIARISKYKNIFKKYIKSFCD